MSKTNVVGIDLGTSFSSIARLNEHGRAEVLSCGDAGEQMIPSVVYFSHDSVLVGNDALKAGSEDPERMVENAKRELGSGFPGWEVDNVFYTPVDISAYILGRLKSDAEQQIGPIDGAVISVPVHFSIQQRELTIAAARQAGLEVLGLVNEPVAAALTFILGEHGLAYASLADEQTILVYDLGGGTFDLSIVHYNEQGIDVKAATGEMKLGGIDWNQRLIDEIAQRFWDKRGYDIRRDAKLLRKLAESIEAGKRSLSDPNKPWTNVSIRYEDCSESFKITRQEFEKATEDLVERTRKLTDGLVRSSLGRWDYLQQVLPVGGATRMPMIREAIRKMCLKTMGEVFGIEPNYRLSPDLAITEGAALYAGLIGGDGAPGTEWAKKTYVPTMINSFGLGLAVRNHTGKRVNHILIPASTKLPASVSVGVETIKANQERIALKIVEAVDENFREEDILLRCELDNLPRNLPEGSAFDVELTYETSGLLQVVARHRDSGRIATARLKRDIEQAVKLEAPREDAQRIANIVESTVREEKVDAHQVVIDPTLAEANQQEKSDSMSQPSTKTEEPAKEDARWSSVAGTDRSLIERVNTDAMAQPMIEPMEPLTLDLDETAELLPLDLSDVQEPLMLDLDEPLELLPLDEDEEQPTKSFDVPARAPRKKEVEPPLSLD